MDEFFVLQYYWPWWFIATVLLVGLVVDKWLSSSHRQGLFSNPPEHQLPTQSEYRPPIIYTAENVGKKYLYHIAIDGKLRQQFHVREIRGATFLIGVFQRGDDCEGQGRAHFTGWATQLPSDRLIHHWDLLRVPPV